MAAMAAANLVAGVRGEPLPTPVLATGLSGRVGLDEPWRYRPPAQNSQAASIAGAHSLMKEIMATLDDATRTQIRNIEARTGRSMDAWLPLSSSSGLVKHGAIVAWLKSEHGFGHGDANLVALTALRGPAAPEGDALVDAIYAGPKASLRPFHDRVIALATGFGGDVELAPKQTYVSLRRTKQFGTVGPASGGRLEIGLNLKGIPPSRSP